jgi:hypothetical protein
MKTKDVLNRVIDSFIMDSRFGPKTPKPQNPKTPKPQTMYCPSPFYLLYTSFYLSDTPKVVSIYISLLCTVLLLLLL